MAEVEITDHSEEVKSEMQAAIERALEACGLQCEGYAKLKCAVDTGLLRNSITHALDGESFSVGMYHADKAKGGATKVGFYSGTAPKEAGDDVRSVYIGTNVEYAPYVETGTSRSKAQPFLKPAVQNHQSEYKRILETYLGKG